MINEQELELELKARRHKVIQNAVKSVKKERAERFTQRRRDVEFERDLRNMGVRQ